MVMNCLCSKHTLRCPDMRTAFFSYVTDIFRWFHRVHTSQEFYRFHTFHRFHRSRFHALTWQPWTRLQEKQLHTERTGSEERRGLRTAEGDEREQRKT